MTILIVKCAWCGKIKGIKDGKGVSGISHGICKHCADKCYSALTLHKNNDKMEVV